MALNRTNCATVHVERENKRKKEEKEKKPRKAAFSSDK
jgi:hypothetical protein